MTSLHHSALPIADIRDWQKSSIAAGHLNTMTVVNSALDSTASQ
jgi:hypothetical protein